MLTTGIEYDSRIHLLADVPAAGYLRRELKDPDLFTYFHRLTGNWVVAVWRDARKKDWMLELLLLGPSPDGLTREMVDQLRSMRVTCEEGRKQAAENRRVVARAERDWAAKEEEFAAVTEEAWKELVAAKPSMANDPQVRARAGMMGGARRSNRMEV